MSPEIVQVISLGVCIVGAVVSIMLGNLTPRYSGWMILPLSIFIFNGAFYVLTIITGLRNQDADLYLFVGAIRTLYTLLILTASLCVMWYEVRKRGA